MQQEAGSGVRLVEVLGTLSLAIDLNVGQSMEHALRSAILAVRLGDALGLDETELTDCYYLALLRHVGCTAEARMAAAVFQDEITARTWFAPVVNYALALSSVRYRDFAVGSALGLIIPVALAATLLGVWFR